MMNTNEQQKVLRTYRVNYIAGLPQFPKIIHKISMSIYPYGFLFSGKRFSDLWIPYNTVTKFKLSTGFGSPWVNVLQDAVNEKIIVIEYLTPDQKKLLLKFEMYITNCSTRANYRACKELVAFMKANGIFDQFVSSEAEESPSADIPAMIEKLAELHRKGILTDAEFQSKKAELLKRL